MMPSEKYLKISIVLFSLLVSSSLGSTKNLRIEDVLEKWETDSLSAKIGNLLRSLPRFDIHFNRIPAVWDPTDQTYLESVGILSFPLVAIGVLAFLIGIFALLIKCCCYCCAKEKKFHSYKKSQVVFTRLRFIVVSFILLAAGLACLAANFSIHQAFNRAVDKAYNTEETMVGYLNDIEVILSQLNDTQNIANQLRPFITQVNDTAQISYNYRDTINEVEDDRMLALYGIAGAASLIALLGIFSACCSRKGAACLAVIVVLFAPICWILAGTHLFAGVFVADMCPQLESWIENQPSIGSENQAIVTYYINCAGENPLANVSVTAEMELARAQFELQWAVQNHEPTPVIDALEALVQDLTNLNNDINGLSNCNTTQTAWLEIKKDVCDNILDGFSLILFGAILTGLLYPFLTCFGFCVHSRRHTHGVNGEYVALESYNQNVVITTTQVPSNVPIATPVHSNPPTFNRNSKVVQSSQIYPEIAPPSNNPFITSEVAPTNPFTSSQDFAPAYQEAITYPTITIEDQANLV